MPRARSRIIYACEAQDCKYVTRVKRDLAVHMRRHKTSSVQWKSSAWAVVPVNGDTVLSEDSEQDDHTEEIITFDDGFDKRTAYILENDDLANTLLPTAGQQPINALKEWFSLLFGSRAPPRFRCFRRTTDNKYEYMYSSKETKPSGQAMRRFLHQAAADLLEFVQEFKDNGIFERHKPHLSGRARELFKVLETTPIKGLTLRAALMGDSKWKSVYTGNHGEIVKIRNWLAALRDMILKDLALLPVSDELHASVKRQLHSETNDVTMTDAPTHLTTNTQTNELSGTQFM